MKQFVFTLSSMLFVILPSASIAALVIDFETDSSGNPLSTGQIIDGEFAGFGINISTHDPINHPAMIFDSSAPSGDDFGLGTPNESFGGPGIGSGGGSGQAGENSLDLGNILIISEDGDSSDPDDNAAGGTITFTFDSPVAIGEVDLLNVENSGSVRAFNGSSVLISQVPVASIGSNGFQIIALNATNVSRLEVQLAGSGAIAEIRAIPEPSAFAFLAMCGVIYSLSARIPYLQLVGGKPA